MLTLELTNTWCKLSSDEEHSSLLRAIYKGMQVKHPNAFFIRAHMPKGWDGKVNFMTEKGKFYIGLLPRILDSIEKNIPINVIDRRPPPPECVFTKQVGDDTLRPYQEQAVKAIINNKIGNLVFTRGVIGASMNAGKTHIAAALAASYHKSRVLILLNNSPLFAQFEESLPKLLGNDVGFIRGKNKIPKRVTVAMVQTICKSLSQREIKDYLSGVEVLICDECHTCASKTYNTVIRTILNASVVVGLSGTAFNHSDLLKALNVEQHFSGEIYTISAEDLIKKGVSSRVVIKMIQGNWGQYKMAGFNNEYHYNITKNVKRYKAINSRINRNLGMGRIPMMVVAKYHDNIELLYDSIIKEFPKLRVDYIHVNRRDRQKVINNFKSGKLDILVASLLIKTGQNMPLIKCLINTSGGLSQIGALQLLGRAYRKHTSKKVTYFEDIWDEGNYLSRHSKKRMQYYKAEGFKVKIIKI